MTTRMAKKHRAFTLVEIAICVGLSTVVLGAAMFVYVSSMKAHERASRANDTLEATITLLANLERDLRQIRVVPGKKVAGYAFRLSADGRSITIRTPCEGGNIHEPDDIIVYQAEKLGKDYLTITRKLLHPDGEVRKERTFRNIAVKVVRYGVDLSQSPDLALLRLRLLVTTPNEKAEGENIWPVERVFRLPCAYGVKGKLNYAILPTPKISSAGGPMKRFSRWFIKKRGLSLVEVLVALAIVAFCLTPLLSLQSGEVASLNLLKEELLIGNLLDDITELLADAPNSLPISSLLKKEGDVFTFALPKNISIRALRYPNLATGAMEPAFENLYNRRIKGVDPNVKATICPDFNGQSHLNHLTLVISWKSRRGTVKSRKISRLFYGAIIEGPAAGATIPFGATN